MQGLEWQHEASQPAASKTKTPPSINLLQPKMVLTSGSTLSPVSRIAPAELPAIAAGGQFATRRRTGSFLWNHSSLDSLLVGCC